MSERSSLEEEFRIIDAQHTLYQRMNAELKMLRILVLSKGKPNLHDRWKIKEIVERYPDFAYYLENP